MTRILSVGVAQMGPVARDEPRASCVRRLMDLMRQAHDRGCRFVVFPEIALTTFFPRWYFEDVSEVDIFCERQMPGPETQPLFDEAARLGIGFYLGYAELVEEAGETRRFNTSILVDEGGRVVGKYQKIHLPGQKKRNPKYPLRGYEKRYFSVGDIGFPVWRTMDGVFGMCICNDRRWPETFRVMGLQGAEIVAVGYNTPAINTAAPHEPVHLRMFHNHITMQAAAYQNGIWIASAAKAGLEEDNQMIGGSCIISPTGEIVALCNTEDEELIVADCDLDLGKYIKETVFNFAEHRRIEHYGLITKQTESRPPPEE